MKEFILPHGFLGVERFEFSADAAISCMDSGLDSIRGLWKARKINKEKYGEKLKEFVINNNGHRPGLHYFYEWCQVTGRPQEALKYFEAAAKEFPNDLELATDYGGVLRQLGFYAEAVKVLSRVLSVKPNHQRARLFIADALLYTGRLDDAYFFAEELIREGCTKPQHLPHLYAALLTMGDRESLEKFETPVLSAFVPVSPLLAAPHFLNMLNEPAQGGYQKLLIDKWGDMISKIALSSPSAFRRKNHGEVLHVGFLSSDFRDHPMGRWFLELIRLKHVINDIRFYCYAGAASMQGDKVHEEIKNSAHHFVDIHDLSDKQAAERIRADGIDILIDLNGHAGGNYVVKGHTARSRLAVLAYQPAPVQALLLGCMSTTGLPAVDYIIAEPGYKPLQTQSYREDFIVLTKPYPAPIPDAEIKPRNGKKFTIGSMCRPTKLTPDTIDMIGCTMRHLPEAEFLYVRPEASSKKLQENIIRQFALRGIPASRLRFETNKPGQHLDWYNEMDISIDTYPLSGGATTIEALGMGVPVFTLRGNDMASRQSAHYIELLGLGDYLIGRNIHEVAVKAVHLAAKGGFLKTLRQTLRPTMQNIFHSDPKAFGEAFQTVLWRMYDQKFNQLSRATAKHLADGMGSRQSA